MHGTTSVLVAVRKAARQVEKTRCRCRCWRWSVARGKPDIERAEENPLRIIRINGDALVVIVLEVIAGLVVTVSERAALRTFHITPSIAAVCRSPGTQLAGGLILAPVVVILGNGLDLCVNVIGVTRRDGNINAPELNANRRRIAR